MEAIVAQLSYYPEICLNDLGKAVKPLNETSRYTTQDSK
jgi:hypothetical protein